MSVTVPTFWTWKSHYFTFIKNGLLLWDHRSHDWEQGSDQFEVLLLAIILHNRCQSEHSISYFLADIFSWFDFAFVWTLWVYCPHTHTHTVRIFICSTACPPKSCSKIVQWLPLFKVNFSENTLQLSNQTPQTPGVVPHSILVTSINSSSVYDISWLYSSRGFWKDG